MHARHKFYRSLLVVPTMLAAFAAHSDEEAKTVIGPSNPDLYNGALALRDGDGETGVRLTERGLRVAQNARDEKTGHSNLCAGYLLKNELERALEHCNWVLERDKEHWRTYNNRALVYMRLERFDEAEADIVNGQALRPGSRNLKIVKGMYLDETKPVRENIELDERREPAAQADADAGASAD